MKKEERHQIKRDELVTVFERTELYLVRNIRRVAGVVGGVALAAAAGYGLHAWQEGREAKASFALSGIIQAYRAAVVTSPEALAQIPTGTVAYATAEERAGKVIELADALLNEHSGTSAAPKALYYKGLALDDVGKRDDATRVLEDVLKRYPADFVAAKARFKLAQMKESAKNPAEALLQYQALLDDPKGTFPKEEALLGIGRCQEELGRKEDALATYRKLISDYPDSDYQNEARRKVEQHS